MKLSLSCRVAEVSNNKEKSFLPIKSLIKLAVLNGFEGISLRPSVVSTNSSIDDINNLRSIFNFYNIKVSMVTSNIHLAKNDNFSSDNLRNIKPCLDLANKLGTSLVRIMIKNKEDIYFAKKALDEALERGITLTQQTHWGTMAETVHDTLSLVKEISRDNFGITYEPANLMACGSEYEINALETLLPHIVNFYFQNIKLDQNGNHEFNTFKNGKVSVSYIPLDDQDGISIIPLLNFLKENKYSGWFTVHQPLLEGQNINLAVQEAANLFLPYKS